MEVTAIVLNLGKDVFRFIELAAISTGDLGLTKEA